MARRRRVLFATSNGTGLGHLNRAMAIARRLPDGFETSFFTLSQAAPVVAATGHEVDYLASYRRNASGTDRAWNMRLRRMLETLLDERRPDVVVFDGVHPYRALTHVLTAEGAPPSIWTRRPMWRAGSSAAPLRRAGAFDAVLEPGELAAELDRGPTVALRDAARRVDPIVLLDRAELLNRDRAASELGLDPSRRTALVSLGQGGEVDRAVARTLRVLTSQPGLQVAALQSSIAAGLEVPDGVVHLRSTFPMSRYFHAFDMAVAAAGYNAFHELIALGVPSLFVPMARNTDDQPARARWAASSGVGLAVSGASDPELEARLEELADPAEGERLRSRCAEAFPGNGAGASAAMVAKVAAGGDAAARRRPGRFERWLRLSSHPVGPTLPLVLALGGRDLLRNPERRRPHLVVLAVGVPPGELTERVGSVIRAAGTDPGRALVLTDSWELPALRGLGVAFEHLPALDPEASAPGPELERQRRRVRVLLAGRRPHRAVSVGRLGPEILGLPEGS